MDLNRYLISKLFSTLLGLLLIAAGCYVSFHFIYQSIWEVRGLVRSPYPISVFSSPAVLYGVSILLLAVIVGWIFTFGRSIWKAIKNKSDWSRISIITGISLVLMSLLLIGIYYLCVKGYHTYIIYKVVEIVGTPEVNPKVRGLVIQLAKPDLMRGILYVTTGSLSWWYFGKAAKNMLFSSKNVLHHDMVS